MLSSLQCYLIFVEDDIEVVDSSLYGLVTGKGRELVAAEVSCRRGCVLFFEVNQPSDVRGHPV